MYWNDNADLEGRSPRSKYLKGKINKIFKKEHVSYAFVGAQMFSP